MNSSGEETSLTAPVPVPRYILQIGIVDGELAIPHPVSGWRIEGYAGDKEARVMLTSVTVLRPLMWR